MPSLASAQYNENDIPAGMELIKVGQTNIVIPKDMKIRRGGGGLVVLESADEYVARKIFDMETRLKTIEAETKELKKEFEELKEGLKKIEETLKAGKKQKKEEAVKKP